MILGYGNDGLLHVSEQMRLILLMRNSPSRLNDLLRHASGSSSALATTIVLKRIVHGLQPARRRRDNNDCDPKAIL